jgi:hypothetical protein
LKKNVIYYNDMEYCESKQNPDCWNMPLNLFLCLAVHGLTIPYLLGSVEFPILLLAGLFYLFMIIECCVCSTRKFIYNLTLGENIFGEINENRNKAPKVTYHVQNYHYETKTRKQNGKTHTERVRVNTHSAAQDYRYAEWIDISPDSSAVEYVKGQKLVRLDFSLKVDYTPQANQSFICQEYYFKKANFRDAHHDYRVSKAIPDMRENVLIFNSDANTLPWYTGRGTFWAFSMLGFSWLFRIIFVSNTKRVSYEYIKLITQ